MSAKHTPGPWRFQAIEPNGIAEHYHVWGPSVSIQSSASRASVEKDMLLIAAAPELLEALRKAIQLLPEIQQTSTRDSIIREARSAIVKATGEQP